MRPLFFFFLLLISCQSFAQQDTVVTSDFSYETNNLIDKKNVHIILIDSITRKKRNEGNFLNNKENGLWEVYNVDGTIWRQQSYKEGIKDGFWFIHHKNGFFERKEQYRDGTLVAGYCYNDKGEELPYFKEPLNYADRMPVASFDVKKYLSDNLHYPKSDRKADVHGNVIVKFIVKEDGTIFNAEVIRGIDSLCDEEAKRLVMAMKPWKPGQQDGKNVSVYFTQSISFRQ